MLVGCVQLMLFLRYSSLSPETKVIYGSTLNVKEIEDGNILFIMQDVFSI